MMPNHLHAVIAFTNKGKSINSYVSTMKRFLVYELVRRLKQQQQSQILFLLEEGVTPADKKKGKPAEMGTHEKLLQKEGRYAELFNLQAVGYQ